MTIEDRQQVGALVAHYRELRHLSRAALGRAVDLSRPTISRIERGERGVTPAYAAAFIRVLDLSPEDQERFIALTMSARAIAEGATVAEEDQVRTDLLDAFARARLIRQYGDPPRYLTGWMQGRVAVARFQANRAIPLLRRAALLAEAHAHDDLLSIMFLDYADALTLGGRPRASGEWIHDRCLPLAHHMRREAPEAPRTAMNLARAYVNLVANAYNQGDETECWAMHQQALPWLEAADDHCGWAKSLFYLALFRFWQGRFTEAETLAREGLVHAEAIQMHRDVWWSVRDVLGLARTWWRVTFLALLIDILVWQGRGDTTDYDDRVRDYLDEKPFWVRDFPPFAPRYRWLAPGDSHSRTKTQRMLADWVQQTAQGGCPNIQADLLIVQGDFVRRASPLRDSDRAEAAHYYRTALTLATRRATYGDGFALHAATARQRLDDLAQGRPLHPLP